MPYLIFTLIFLGIVVLNLKKEDSANHQDPNAVYSEVFKELDSAPKSAKFTVGDCFSYLDKNYKVDLRK